MPEVAAEDLSYPDHLTSGHLHFSVDSALIRELGERLVGQPQIALAELVKNSYDADAKAVIVRFEEDRIEVRDNGHGMTLKELTNLWMRIGSAHKERLRRSRQFKRPLTGSKGVGRLAAQFLATEIELRTVSASDPSTEVVIEVDWNQAVAAGDLTEAEASYREITPETRFPDGEGHGTVLILKNLNQSWGNDEISELAREVWWLQPPFNLSDGQSSSNQGFDIRFESPDPEAAATFERQVAVILKAWQVKITGVLQAPEGRPDGEFGHVSVAFEYHDGSRVIDSFRIPKCTLHSASFEVRVFELKYRQPGGIPVETARRYFREHGGVYVYDAGFRLPYYGSEIDWLDLNLDVARRLTVSNLLPKELNVQRGLLRLATNDRLFGVVRVNTAEEARRSKESATVALAEQSEVAGENGGAGQHLKIQVSRDRLVDNRAYKSLVYMLRWPIDRAAMLEASRQALRSAAKPGGAQPSEKARRVADVLDEYRDQIPGEVLSPLRKAVDEAVAASETQAEIVAGRASLLGALATAGIAALAYEHEVQKQYQVLEEVARSLASGAGQSEGSLRAAEQIKEWADRARATRGLFSHLLDEESRDVRGRFVARQLLRDVWDQLGVFTRGVDLEFQDFDPTLRLPEGGFAQWNALFQNIFINAINAVIDTDMRRIGASSRSNGRHCAVLIQDTGVGVDLDSSEELFEPFKRGLAISEERRALGAGGSGLGLTIVRMIASDVGATVRFVTPETSFNTAVEVRWNQT
ncbi:ATP-binding protein [Rubrivirga sp. IMCC43871]|uniref:ATP-binding protein n=1 Tax=Rubrivirga sp. IMCC43871 TaxID=3391575 RepID=UPI0039903345